MSLKPLIAGMSQTPAAGSGSGDVTASGTLTNNSIILGGGTKVVKATTTGTGVVSALGNNIGSAGAPVVFDGDAGTPSALVGTNITGTAAGLTAGAASAVALGGITGLGTNVATSLAVNVGTAGAPVVQDGALGTPSSGTLTNCTGLPASGVAGTSLTQASTAHAIQIAQIVTLTSAGTDSFTGTAGVTATAYNNGDTYVFIANNANTGAASLDIDGLGAITIVKVAGGVTTTLADNDIRSGQVCIVSYDGTNFQLQSTLGNAGGGGLGGSTGSVDNAMLRADGTGGATVQSSDITVSDASTSTQNQVAIANAHAGQTNSTLVLSPKGTGAIQGGPVADGAATGGNARGANAVDLQTSRTAATNVASGLRSVIAGGNRNTASGQDSVVAGGDQGIASGNNSSVGGGFNNQATGNRSAIIGGQSHSAAGGDSAILGGASNQTTTTGGVASGKDARSDRIWMRAHSAGQFAANGDSQAVQFVVRNKTTNDTPTTLFLDGSSTRLTIPSGKVLSCIIRITGIKSDGSAVADYVRQYALKNVGGTTSEVYAPVTIGTDNAAGTAIAITADDTNDALQINVTGIAAETWRWTATVEGIEIAYGT